MSQSVADALATDPLAPVVSRLWAEGRGRPEFLATGIPSLSWQVTTDAPGWLQASADIEVRRGATARSTSASTNDATESPTTETFTVSGRDSQHVPWPASALAAYDSAEVRVRVRGEDGSASEFSEWHLLRTAALRADDWVAPFIALAGPTDPNLANARNRERGTARFRTEFTLRDDAVSAVLSATAHGVYELTLAGSVVGDEVLAPGWTAYNDRLTFQSYDVTDRLAAGEPVVLGATVAEGWYGERFGFDGNFATFYPGPIALSAQLVVTYADGTVARVVTDDRWEGTAEGPVVSAGIYPGEAFDARKDDDALLTVGAEFPAPAAIRELSREEADPERLVPSFAPPVRRIQNVPAQRIFTSRSGRTLVDFGQNLVGWLELTIDAPAGHEVTLRHAEVLEDGELGIRPLRFAKATDTFTGAGDGERVWSPRFTFQGFRYAEISNWPGELALEQVNAVVVHTDMVRTGYLETSNAKLNQLHSNVLWGMRGNFLSLPTDCPQRDERLGWTGDIQVFTPTASYLFDTSGFLGSWLRDLEAEQRRGQGVVPFVVPSPLPTQPMPAAAWGDAATLVPDALFERFADTAALAAQYESMTRWVGVVDALAGDDHLWTGGFQFGDWLDPSAPPENPAKAKTDPDIVATAYFYRSATRTAEAARVLGHVADATRYGELADGIRSAFLREYVTPAGRMMSDAHTAYAIAIGFELITEPAALATAGARLAELVRSHGYRIGTGFVGTPLICDALVRGGQSDVAYRLLLEEGCPSWLYPITMGATTIWERWDSMLPDGSINPGEMTSFNHYALGAVADWMQRSIGGIAPGAPGYSVVDIAPVLGGGLTSAHASLETGFGLVDVSWMLDGPSFSLVSVVPPNTTARITLPGAGVDAAIEVGSGRHKFTVDLSALVSVDNVEALTLETPLSQLVGDTEARDGLEALFAELGYFIGLGWTKDGRWKSGSPLGKSLIMMPPHNVARVEEYLAALNASRAAR
jgi:alpha-L-rhamnosidase